MTTPLTSAAHKNEVHLAGVLAKEPVIRFSTTGKKVANLRVDTTYKQSTEHHDVVAWEQLADKVEGFAKGEFIKVVGRLQTRSWEDANKAKHYRTEIIAWQIVAPAREPVTISTTGLEVTDDDLPNF